MDTWRRLATIQHGTKLFLVDYGAVWYTPLFLGSTHRSYELFYQIGLSEFGNFGTIEFTGRLDLRDLLVMSMKSNGQADMTQEAQEKEIQVRTPT